MKKEFDETMQNSDVNEAENTADNTLEEGVETPDASTKEETPVADELEDTLNLTEEERLQSVAETLAKAMEEESASKKATDSLEKELNDRLMRQMAEFDNYRKRTEKEKASMFELGAKNIIEKILPTIDNFERALAAVPPDKEAEAFAQGVEMIYNQMLKDLDEAGVRVIESVGQAFNPDLHHAVMHVEDDSVGENTIVEEFQKGYLYKGIVVRYSMVKVAN